MSSLSRLWRPRLLMLALLASLLWWGLSNIPLGEIGATLSRLTLGQILAIIGINLLVLVSFTSRWWLILRSLGHHIPFIQLVGYRLAGFGLSYFTPGPQFGGEPLQIHLTRTRHPVPTSSAIAAVSLDKLFELLANFSFLAIGILAMTRSNLFHDRYAAPFILLAGLLLLLPGVYLLSLRAGWRALRWVFRRTPRRILLHPFAQKTSQALLSSEAHMIHFCQQRFTSLLLALAISLFSWILVVTEYWLTLTFLGQPLELAQVLSLLTAARMAFLLPSPGALGTLEASQILMMQALGLNPALAVSVGLLIRGRDLVLGSLGLGLGSYLLRREPLNAMPSQAGD